MLFPPTYRIMEDISDIAGDLEVEEIQLAFEALRNRETAGMDREDYARLLRTSVAYIRATVEARVAAEQLQIAITNYVNQEVA